ncbi:MAG: gamma-glutamyltransferase [Planctomycetes bacterium]|nr:gamma-glutamyltransferase [Planctomycetota bacterium]
MRASRSLAVDGSTRRSDAACATRRPARPSVALAAAFVLALLASCRGGSPIAVQAHWPTPKAGAVATEHPLATQAALDVLDRGGNAADAAVAAALVLAVVHPQAGNLGGGGFALWVPHTGDADALDFREVAPRAVRPELYLGPDGKRVAARSLRGPYSVAVPGSPLGLWEPHRRHGSGRLRFSELARRAIELAQQGFEVDAFLARDLAEPGVQERFSPSARSVFFPGGVALRAGHVLRQPGLAEALGLLASEGPSAFYQGRIGAAMLQELDAAPVPGADATGRGWMTAADLAGYEVRSEKPLRGWFRGLEIVTMPPPSSGGSCCSRCSASSRACRSTRSAIARSRTRPSCARTARRAPASSAVSTSAWRTGGSRACAARSPTARSTWAIRASTRCR